MSMADPQSKETMASGPHSQASASSGHSHGIGPGASRWTREDTQLSKAMSQLLRHKPNLTLDQAGYAKLSDMLVHPRLRNLNPTLEWMMHIVRLNAKQRFALNEAGTHIRAKQGHSIKVDPSKLLRKLGTGDIGDMIPTCALHSTYFSNVPSIMQIGLLPGGTRGAKYRQHIHLAISHRPDAGLREGSDLILMVDLMKAQKAGCVFYVSDNNVVLTADCIPPSCIVRATCTSTGAAFDLSQYRAKYMWGCTASAKLFHVRTLLQIMLTLRATSSHLLLSNCCRCFLPSTFAQPEALFSQPTCCNEQIFSGQSTLTRHTGLERWHFCQVGQSPLVRSKEQAFKTALPTGAGFGSLINERTWGARSVLPHCRYKSRASVSLHYPRQTALLSLLPAIPRLKTTMQRGTPIGRERHYTWRTNARRSEASSPSKMTSTDRSTGGGPSTGPAAGSQESAASAEAPSKAPSKRPRPSSAPALTTPRGTVDKMPRGATSFEQTPRRSPTSSVGIGAMQTDVRDAGPHIPSRDAHNSDHQDLNRCQNNGNRGAPPRQSTQTMPGPLTLRMALRARTRPSIWSARHKIQTERWRNQCQSKITDVACHHPHPR